MCESPCNALPNEVLLQIYEYIPYGEHCLVNKEVYNHCKNRALDCFYSDTCKEHTCGHKCNMLFSYKETVGFLPDEFGISERLEEYREFSLCNICFSITLVDYIKKFKHLPFLRGEGYTFVKNVKNIRKNIKPEEYLQMISNKTINKLANVVFEDISPKLKPIYYTRFHVYYYNKDKYDAILKQKNISLLLA